MAALDPAHPCFVCGQLRRRRLARLAETTVFSCQSCGLVYCDPLPRIASASSGDHSILTEERYTQALLDNASKREACHRVLARRRHEVFAGALGRAHFRLLEVGCGIAGLAPEWLRLGVEYHGIDLDARVCELARQRGVSNVEVVDFMGYPAPGPFDVICFSQVLEHITQPRAFLDKVSSLLVPGGIVHLDVPNHTSLSGLLHMLLPRPTCRFGGIDYPHHALSYRARTLRQLLATHFDGDVFSVNPDHPVWGQPLAGRPSLAVRSYFRAADWLACRSILVGYGRKRASA